jgi:hypothetical protein
LTNGKTITLISIPKSGTNLFRVLFYNYMCKLSGDETLKNYDHLTSDFPNTVENYVRLNVKKVNKIILPKPYSDFTYTHNIRDAKNCMSPPYIGLYRNPFDFFVSYYFFKYKTRLNPSAEVSSPADLIDLRLNYFIDRFKKLKKLEKENKLILLSYEELFENGTEQLRKVTEWLDIPFDRSMAQLSTIHSSIDKAKEFENKVGYFHTKDRSNAHKIFIESAKFVRNGSIGQWRQYFSDAQKNHVLNSLSNNGINPDQFIFESKLQSQSKK